MTNIKFIPIYHIEWDWTEEELIALTNGLDKPRESDDEDDEDDDDLKEEFDSRIKKDEDVQDR